jgi:chromosome partitioning protein
MHEDEAMLSIAVANPKGGVGKSTLATNLAGWLAHRGHTVMLGDTDRQHSSRQWLARRPPDLPEIRGWDLGEPERAKVPRGTTHIVLDTPAGLRGKRLNGVLRLVDKILIPLQASEFDIDATEAFLNVLSEHTSSLGVQLGLVANRAREGTLALDELRCYLDSAQAPVLGELRDAQLYVQLAGRGLTLWDLAPNRVHNHLVQWQPLLDWLEQ